MYVKWLSIMLLKNSREGNFTIFLSSLITITVNKLLFLILSLFCLQLKANSFGQVLSGNGEQLGHFQRTLHHSGCWLPTVRLFFPKRALFLSLWCLTDKPFIICSLLFTLMYTYSYMDTYLVSVKLEILFLYFS